MDILAAETLRKQRGLAMAKVVRIKKVTDALWVVPSATHKGTYVVNLDAASCTCPDHEETRIKCKHQWALEFARHQVVEADGSIVEQRTLSITYSQPWS